MKFANKLLPLQGGGWEGDGGCLFCGRLLWQAFIPHPHVQVKGLRVFAQSRLSVGLGCTSKWNFPTGKYEYGWMALKGASKNLRAFNPQIHSRIFDG